MMPSAADILTAHDLKGEIRRVPNGRPVHDWSCTCGREFHPPLDAQYLLHLIGVAQERALAPVLAFIDQRPEYVKALKDSSGDDDASDYWRWSGGAEARRQLAETLGLTVPHNPGDHATPKTPATVTS